MADKPQRICTVEGCEKNMHYATGLCMAHYQAKRRAKGKAMIKADPTLKVRPSGKYSHQQVDEGLLAIVMHGGDYKAASETTGIPAGTLNDWYRTYTPRYAELRDKHAPLLERKAVEGLLSFFLATEEVKRVALQKTLDALNSEGGVKDPGATLKNLALAQGIAGTKLMELTGRPTSIIEHRSANEVLATLKRLGAVVDGDADEVPSQQEIEATVVASDAHTDVAATPADSHEAARS